jgi:membrane-bound lytic murein transglycosylase D
MAKNPSEYGLDHIAPDQPLEMDRVKIDYSVDLRLVAECVDSPVATLQELNPSLLRMITPKAGEFELHLPVGTAEKFQTAIAAIPRDMRVWWRYHTVGANDTLASIARIYRTTPKAILQVNHLDGSRLEAEAKLIVPVVPGRRPLNEQGTTYSRHLTRYKVRRGDTVASVADNFGVPAEQVRRWNRLHRNSLRPGRVLLIHLPVSLDTSSASRKEGSKSKAHGRMQAEASQGVLHKVRRGETLTGIAGSYNVSVDELRRNNAKAASNLRAGDVLVIKQAR